MTNNRNNFDVENLRFLYEKYQEKEIFEINQIWENLKFFMTLISILIPVMSAIPFIFNLENLILNKILKISIIAGISLFIIILLFNIKSNSERHYKRWAEWRGTCIKISEKLNLNKESNFTIFSEDKYLHPFKYINPTEYAKSEQKITSLDKFIDIKSKFKNSFINKIKNIFWCTFALIIILSSILIFILIFI